MIYFIGWFVGSFFSWICLLKVTKVVLGQTSFNCGDLMLYGLLAILAGPIGIGAALFIWIIEKLMSSNYESTKCKSFTKWIIDKI